MMGAGDLLQQRSESFKKNHSKEITDNTIPEIPVDLVRMRNMTAVGLAQGPFNHYFYSFLDRVLPGKNTGSIIKKTILDQTIASPTCLGIFFLGLGCLEQRSFKEIIDELRLKIFDVWKVSEEIANKICASNLDVIKKLKNDMIKNFKIIN